MIALLRVAFLAVPLTLWYSIRIRWAALRGTPDLEALCDELPRSWAVRLLEAARVRVRVSGEGLPEEGRLRVLVSNHTSWFDVLALAACVPGRCRFVGKRELAYVPFFGRAFHACGNVLIDRSDRGRALESMEQVRRRLEREHATIIVFPEGTRSVTGEMGPFKKGAFVLAIQTGSSVIPVRVEGGRDVMPKGAWRIRAGTIHVRIGGEIPVRGLTLDDRDALTRSAWDAVSALGAPRHPARTGS